MKIIDCTIRDGGHINNWEFDDLTVRAAYYAASKSGVDFFEVGYRVSDSKKNLGKYAYSNDDFLFTLFENSDQNCKLLIMVDAGKADEINFLKCESRKTPIFGIRVAAYPFEYEKAINLIDKLYALGYKVYLNLMASSEISNAQYSILENWSEKYKIESIYFADSFGSFIPSDIPFYVNKLKGIGFINIGFHSHNNLQMAFANTLKAIESGANYIDASIYGMGRGAGNLPIEILLGYLEKQGNIKYNTVPYLDVIQNHFLDLFKKFTWGYGLRVLLGGLSNIHPYYIDELFEQNSYSIDEIWAASKLIKEKCPTSYSSKELKKLINDRFYTPFTEEKVREIFIEISKEFKLLPSEDSFTQGDFELKNKHIGQKFLIIANGPSILKYKDEIDELVRKENFITIGVNYLQNLFTPNYHLFISKKRFLKYYSTISPNSSLILPSFFGKKIAFNAQASKISYFDLGITSEIHGDCVLDISKQEVMNPNVSISAILLANMMGASEIYAVGIDGYLNEQDEKMNFFYNEDETPDDKEIASVRYEMFAKELERTNFFLQKCGTPFTILTPTSHKKYFRNQFNK